MIASSQLQKKFLPLLIVALFAGSLGSCTQQPTPQATRSLRGTGDISFVCLEQSADAKSSGRPLDACPAYYGDSERKLVGLATQQETGEVALIDFSQCQDGGGCSGRVQDLEVTQPGANFLPVGAEPVSIASTPGGVASFVGVAELGKEGIFALPSSCIGARTEREAIRDLRSWPACRLPAAPGELTVLVDPLRQTACDGGESSVDQSERECPADLDEEWGQSGRRKLLVTLPSLGVLVTLDAQRVLDREPGSFEPCPIERTVSLEVALPTEPVEQRVPDDLVSEDPSCRPADASHLPPEQLFAPRPVDIATAEDRLYVADAAAPVIHVLDATDVCSLREVEPLLPVSYSQPGLVVTTRRLAVSPMTTAGQRFVYAVDNAAGPSAGSVMVFDISAGARERTPLVRPRSAFVTNEPPDRIQFDQEVRDVEFVKIDQPIADRDGVAVEGLSCEPDPRKGDSTVATQYRIPNEEGGAGPTKLRGVFAALALQSGYVSFVDVEDLDAPCRRPSQTNAESTPDQRGCFDDELPGPLERDGAPTVTDEFSCNIVQPHRARAATLFDESGPGTAPFIRSFPTLRGEDGGSLAVDQSERGRPQPRLLGLNFTPGRVVDGEAAGDAEVFVGATRYENEPNASDRLVLDPARSERNSVVLPFAEPRAYTSDSINTVAYEGPVRGISDAPYEWLPRAELTAELTGLPEELASGAQYGVLRGGVNADYCASGIEDTLLMQERAARLGPELEPEQVLEFAKRHADIAQITADFLPQDDEYWDRAPGKQCGAKYQSDDDAVTGRRMCELFFGTEALPDRNRELRIVRALDDRLILEPRYESAAGARAAILDLVQCCFPGGVEFQVRAAEHWVFRSNGQFGHRVRTNPESFACENSCDPLLENKEGRIFEISCDGPDCAVGGGAPAIGPSVFEPDDDAEDSAPVARSLVCVLSEHPEGGVQPGAPGFECAYTGLTARFAIYRGMSPSARDMQFTWSTSGGFTPLAVDLFAVADFRTTTSPQKIVFVPQINRLIVADGGSTGLFMVGLRRRDGGPGLSSAYAY